MKTSDAEFIQDVRLLNVVYFLLVISFLFMASGCSSTERRDNGELMIKMTLLMATHDFSKRVVSDKPIPDQGVPGFYGFVPRREGFPVPSR